MKISQNFLGGGGGSAKQKPSMAGLWIYFLELHNVFLIWHLNVMKKSYVYMLTHTLSEFSQFLVLHRTLWFYQLVPLHLTCHQAVHRKSRYSQRTALVVKGRRHSCFLEWNLMQFLRLMTTFYLIFGQFEWSSELPLCPLQGLIAKTKHLLGVINIFQSAPLNFHRALRGEGRG